MYIATEDMIAFALKAQHVVYKKRRSQGVCLHSLHYKFACTHMSGALVYIILLLDLVARHARVVPV